MPVGRAYGKACFSQSDLAWEQGLTEKQEKLAAKLRRCEQRLANLQKEYDAIHVCPLILAATACLSRLAALASSCLGGSCSTSHHGSRVRTQVFIGSAHVHLSVLPQSMSILRT